MHRQLLILLCFISVIARGQIKAGTDKTRINVACDKIMSALVNKNYDAVVSLLKENSVISAASVDSLKPQIISGIEISSTNYGKLLGSTFIKEKKAADIAINRYYAIRFERYFLKCQFSLYNNGKRWVITGFNFDEEFSDLF